MLTWLRNPAAPTAIPSLVTAVAAFLRVQHKAAEEVAAEPLPSPPETPPLEAYETLFDVEDRIREESLLKRQNLQEGAEIIDQDLVAYQHAHAVLKGAIVGCSVATCPAHVSLLREV